jgi:RNA polymerase sigma-70 factor, ECF subfamily
MTVKLISATPQAVFQTARIDNRPSAACSDTVSIVSMIKSKNERGFHMLYEKYSGALYCSILKFGIRSQVAEDLLQDTFVKIWKNIDNFDANKGSLFTWMLRIAKNKAIDYLRSTAYQQQLACENIDLLLQHQDCSCTRHQAYNDAESNDFKKNTLVQLNEKYAEVIEMIYFYGWTQEQTAVLLKIPLGTVKTRARKGLNALKMLYKY